MEDNAAQSGQPVDPQEALNRLQQLEEETRRLREQLQAAPAATPAPQPAPAEPAAATPTPVPATTAATEDEEKLPDPPSDRQKEEADKLIQRYRLEKQRGNKEFAGRYLAEAVALAPGYSLVVECQADEALDSRKTIEAKRLYKRAVAIDPKNVSAETKFANLVFRADAAAASAALNINEVSANAKTASILSAIIPGAGQIVTGQYVKGGLIILLWVALIFFCPAGLRSIASLASGRPDVQAGPLMAVIAALFVYIGNLVDMSAYSKSLAAHRMMAGVTEKKERPVLPQEAGNLPFE